MRKPAALNMSSVCLTAAAHPAVTTVSTRTNHMCFIPADTRNANATEMATGAARDPKAQVREPYNHHLETLRVELLVSSPYTRAQQWFWAVQSAALWVGTG